MNEWIIIRRIILLFMWPLPNDLMKIEHQFRGCCGKSIRTALRRGNLWNYWGTSIMICLYRLNLHHVCKYSTHGCSWQIGCVKQLQEQEIDVKKPLFIEPGHYAKQWVQLNTGTRLQNKILEKCIIDTLTSYKIHLAAVKGVVPLSVNHL